MTEQERKPHNEPEKITDIDGGYSFIFKQGDQQCYAEKNHVGGVLTYLIVGLHCPLIASKLNINLYSSQLSKTNTDGKQGLGINKLINKEIYPLPKQLQRN